MEGSNSESALADTGDYIGLVEIYRGKDCIAQFYENMRISEDEQEANANLCASAPDLLEENTKLKTLNAELIEAWEKYYRYLNIDDQKIIEKLIQKAKGGE